jgi:DNA mismatch repair protein MutL
MPKICKIVGYAKIAAGEVIERPASVVKELLENAIDAEATQIFITVGNAGKDLIQILDNGAGIPEDDMVIAFHRYTSSKIQNADQLEEIESLGFRGEALASIAAVSQIEIISRPASQPYAICLELDEGKLQSEEQCGSPQGTTIKIKNLFFNLPVRQKFLRTNRVELGHITDVITRYSLAYPLIHFKLIHNGLTLINSPAWKSSTISKEKPQSEQSLPIEAYGYSLQTIYGKKVTSQMIPVEYADLDLKLYGYFGLPGVARSEKGAASLFVNNRLVTNKMISEVITDAYKDYLMKHRYPFFVIFIEVSPKTVDFNVHPSKKIVKFLNEQKFMTDLRHIVFRLIKQHFQQSHIQNNRTSNTLPPSTKSANDYWSVQGKFIAPSSPQVHPSVSESRPKTKTKASSKSTPYPPSAGSKFGPTTVQTHFHSTKKQSLSLKVPTSTTILLNSLGGSKTDEKTPSGGTSLDQVSLELPSIPVKQLPPLHYLSTGIQAGETYLIFQNEEGLVLIDQHAAHERINYEKVERSFEQDKVSIQQLLAPIKMDVAPNEVDFIKEVIPQIKQYGFDIDHFGGQSFIVRTIPAFLSKKTLSETFITDTCLDLLRLGKGQAFTDLKREIIQYLACHMSITAGEEIWDRSRIQRLVQDLDNCSNPHHCAHGRPTYIKIPYQELDKWFHRTV